MDEISMANIVVTYVELVEGYVTALSAQLFPSMRQLLYYGLAISFAIEFTKMAYGKFDPFVTSTMLMFASVSIGIMEGSGPELVENLFNLTLQLMVFGASVAIVGAAAQSGEIRSVDIEPSSGAESLAQLVTVASASLENVFNLAQIIWGEAGLTNIGAFFIAILVILPFFLIMVILTAQIAVGVFRLMMISAFMPYLFMIISFKWGRERVIDGFNTLLSSVFIIFAVCVVLGLVVSGVDIVSQQALQNAVDDSTSFARFSNPHIIVLMALGWICAALMTEATGIANSISRTSLTNTAVGVITAGFTATAAAMAKKSGSGFAGAVNLATSQEARDSFKKAALDRWTGASNAAKAAMAVTMPGKYIATKAAEKLTK